MAKSAPDLDRESALLGVIKEQLVLLGLQVFYVGLVHTEAYYARLSVNYQFLSLPSFHIVYRGITSLFESPSLLVPYVIAAMALLLLKGLAAEPGSRFGRHRATITYGAALILVLTTYPLARRAGVASAAEDLQEDTCRLPRIQRLDWDNGEPLTAGAGYRLLLVDGQYVTFFKPLPRGETSTAPNIRRIATSHVLDFETIR
jgi:hypothetical protein